MTVREAKSIDKCFWLVYRIALWPDTDKETHRVEMNAMLADKEKFGVFVALDGQNRPCGFIEASIKEDLAKGCLAQKMGYIEGWYVAPEQQRKGLGRALLNQAEEWAKNKGCQVMGSDTAVDHEPSQKAHLAMGFQETDRAIHYRKKLG